MEDEKKDQDKTEEKDSKLSFKSADDLTTFLQDMQGQMENMQQTIDKLSPKEEEQTETKEEEQTEEPTEKEINEIDQLLQSE